MAFIRWTEGADPVRSDAHWRQEEIRRSQSTRMASGTLACPECDAPVSPTGRMTPADALACPYCAHGGAVRDFLSLASPARPARVDVHVRIRAL
jgi:uncharacterized paraquat-inducible protein A